MGQSILQVGITGGIGSGKTTVCQLFETLGIPVYYADIRAKELMVEDPDLAAAIRNTFGEKAYTPEGQLDRAFLAGIVFKDPEKLAQLNGLVHPAVGRDSERWQARQQGVPYTLREAALIYESGSFKHLDKVIVVTAPRELRLQRVMKRDNTSRSAIEARMSKQMPEEEKAARADFIINNDGKHSLIRQVLEIHRQLLHLAQNKVQNGNDEI